MRRSSRDAVLEAVADSVRDVGVRRTTMAEIAADCGMSAGNIYRFFPSKIDIAEDGTLSNRRVWADGVGPDGICLDADGCIWASSGSMTNDCARIREGGEILETVELDRSCFAAMLGGPDRRTLFMLTAEWRGTEDVEDVVRAITGQVLVADAPAPGIGWP
mgnify:CR=1 FL=1